LALTTTDRHEAVAFQSQFELSHVSDPNYVLWVDVYAGTWFVYVGKLI